ncbi:uncharacterized protein AKAME5_002359500 [Lates japonicus]|uniref:Uncharacterized protein n=1 Tax=Lates japonicus TaxID=270547 RepID=A0AAD3RL13_LATJO|nr:uncharacterized protein AKAME5_002359500 [Lates japonicus]
MVGWTFGTINSNYTSCRLDQAGYTRTRGAGRSSRGLLRLQPGALDHRGRPGPRLLLLAGESSCAAGPVRGCCRWREPPQPARSGGCCQWGAPCSRPGPEAAAAGGSRRSRPGPDAAGGSRCGVLKPGGFVSCRPGASGHRRLQAWEVGDLGNLICFETVETETGEERGSGVDRKQVFNDQVTPQIAALLDEDMISDDELKVSQKRKSTRSGSSNTKMSRRTVKQSQEGDSDFVLSQESQSLYTATEIKRFLEQTKGLRLITVEEYFPDLKLFLRSAKILTRKSGMTEDVLSDQEIYRLKKHIVKVKSGTGPFLASRLQAAGVTTLGQVVELAGPQLQDSAGLALKLGFRSRRVTKLLLDHWRKRLSGHELLMLDAFSSGEATVNRQDYFPLIQLSLDLKDCAGLLLDRCPQASLQEASGKTFYHLMDVIFSSCLQRVDLQSICCCARLLSK